MKCVALDRQIDRMTGGVRKAQGRENERPLWKFK